MYFILYQLCFLGLIKAGYLRTPLLCANSPTIILNKVVLPFPFSPTRDVISPNFNSNSGKVSLKSFSFPEYCLVMLLA